MNNGPRGIALHIAVNILDPDHYGGWDGELAGCENDANDMFDLAAAQGFECGQLHTAEATRDNVVQSIRRASSELKAGDFFLITYSGHGGQVPDIDGDEKDLQDETWCLHDGQLLDDELHVLWSEFAPGVRVFVVSDSCHSGTVTKGQGSQRAGDPDAAQGTARFMPREQAVETFRNNKGFYARLQASMPNPRPRIQASVRLYSGCQEDQYSYESNGSGNFTTALKKYFDNGTFEGDYKELHRLIVEELGEKQQPNHLVIGASDPAYDQQRPFKI